MMSTFFANRQQLAHLAAFVASTAMLLWVALLNGFPLLFADSGTYLRIGTEHYFPYDRPMTYGAAILPLHQLLGLWSVVIAQSLFATWLIDRLLRFVLGRTSPVALFGTAAVLAALTSLPWFVGQIMPDMFAGMVILIAYLLLFGWETLARWERWALPVLLALLLAFHLSFLPTLAMVTIVGAVLGWAMRRNGHEAPVHIFRRGGIVLAAFMTAVLALSTLNLAVRGTFRPSISSSAFLLGRLLDANLAQPVIIDMCRTQPLVLCSLHHVLDPATYLPGNDYLWGAYPTLTPAQMAHMPKEENAVIGRTLAEYPGAVARTALSGFGRIFILARAGDGMDRYEDDMQVAQQIRRHFPQSAPAWDASRQQHGSVRALAIVPDRTIGLIATVLNLAILAVAIRRRETALAGLAAMVVATLIFNAFFCSLLSGVVERYQSRVMWMPMLTLAVAAFWWWPLRPANDPR